MWMRDRKDKSHREWYQLMSSLNVWMVPNRLLVYCASCCDTWMPHSNIVCFLLKESHSLLNQKRYTVGEEMYPLSFKKTIVFKLAWGIENFGWHSQTFYLISNLAIIYDESHFSVNLSVLESAFSQISLD